MSFEIPEYLGPTEETSYSNALSVQVRDSPENVRGWRLAGISFSCVPDPVYPPDPAIIAAAKELDPDLTYMVARWAFKPEAARSDGSKVQVFSRHALGRHVKHPNVDKQLFYVQMPADADYPVPNQLDRILPDFEDEVVPSYQALDWSIFWNPWVQLTPKEFRERYIKGAQIRQQKERSAIMIEMEGRQREAQKFWDKCLESISDVEWGQWNRKQAAKQRALRQREAMFRRAQKQQARANRKAQSLTFDLGGH